MTEDPYASASPSPAGAGAPAAGTAALAPAPAGGWQSLHLTLHTDGADTDAFVTGALAPLMDGRYGPNGGAWFFIRYHEGGPHLRIRFRGAGSTGDGA
ncbi:hypothetical protein VR46_42420, partial [Streptomyces sp. NRRL S-444]